MKKGILIYTIIVIITCLVLNTIAIIESSAEFKYLIPSTILLVIGIYFTVKTAINPNLHVGNFFLFLFNAIQVTPILLYGFLYKLSYGPFILISLYNYNDWFSDINFGVYSRIFIFDHNPPSGNFYIGINLIQLSLSIYFFNQMKKINGYILPKMISDFKIYTKNRN